MNLISEISYPDDGKGVDFEIYVLVLVHDLRSSLRAALSKRDGASG